MSRPHRHRPHRPVRSSHHRPEFQPTPAIVEFARTAVASGEPLDLLLAATTLIHFTDPRSIEPDPDPADQVSVEDLLAILVDSGDISAAALAIAIALLRADRATASKVRSGLGLGQKNLPDWLGRLEPVEVVEAVALGDIYADFEDLVLRIRSAAGFEWAMVVKVDLNLAGVVKDAFLVTAPWDEVMAKNRRLARGEGVELLVLSAADACARVRQASALADRFHRPITSETWPARQPLLDWVMAQAPTDGVGYLFPEWDDAEREELKRRLLASPFGTGLEADDIVLDSILKFAIDYGPGDPLRWSPQRVETLLLDWLPGELEAPIDELDRAPRVLDSVIRFAHEEKGLPTPWTVDTAGAVAENSFKYRDIIRSDRRHGRKALPDTGTWAGHLPNPLEIERDWRHEMDQARLDHVALQVGGHHLLGTIDVDLLTAPTQPWDDLPDDIRTVVAEVDDLCQRCSTELFDHEFGIACRLFLSDLAHVSPEVFRRRGRPQSAAAAICWIIGRVNHALYEWQGVLVKDLLAWFGLTGSITTRAKTMIYALGYDHWAFTRDNNLGNNRYLTSKRRRQIVEMRDRVQAHQPR